MKWLNRKAFVSVVILAQASAFLHPSFSSKKSTPPLMSKNRGVMMAAALSVVDFISTKYPDLRDIPNEFLDAIHPPTSNARPATSAIDKEKALIRARAMTSMAPRALLSRGIDILTEDFVYYSTSTGTLNREEYLGLLALLDPAFPDLRMQCKDFEVSTDGGVVFTSQLTGTFMNDITIGGKTIEATRSRYAGDQELSVVTFDDEGRLLSYSTGVVIGEGSKHKSDVGGAGARERADLEKRLESQTIKLEGLSGQKGTATYERVETDVLALTAQLNSIKEEEGMEVMTAQGLGGLGAIISALGQELPSDLTSSYGGVDSVSVDYDLVTIPTECEGIINGNKFTW